MSRLTLGPGGDNPPTVDEARQIRQSLFAAGEEDVDRQGYIRVRTEAEFTAALLGSSQQIEVVETITLTQPHDFTSREIICCPNAFDFSGGGTLTGSGSISRLGERQIYPIFVNAVIGFWDYYTGAVTYGGTPYAALPGQGTLPSVQGSWNKSTREITMWNQFHQVGADAFNNAYDAAKNSLPRKQDTLADANGVIICPPGSYPVNRPIYLNERLLVIGGGGREAAGGNSASTILVADAAFAPETTYTTGETSPIAGGGRLYDLDEDHMVVCIPQNRNNQSRVDTAGGGGDGKSVFEMGMRSFQLNCNGYTNGILVHASTNSFFENISVENYVSRGWWFRASDACRFTGITAEQNDVPLGGDGFYFTGSNIDLDIRRVTLTSNAIAINYTGQNRSGSLSIHGINAENNTEFFYLYRPKGVRLTNFTCQGGGMRLGRIVCNGAGWAPFGAILEGTVTKNPNYLSVEDQGGLVDNWRLATMAVDNQTATTVDDWVDLGHGSGTWGTKWGEVNFDLQREFGFSRQRTALNPPPEYEFNTRRLFNEAQSPNAQRLVDPVDDSDFTPATPYVAIPNAYQPYIRLVGRNKVHVASPETLTKAGLNHRTAIVSAIEQFAGDGGGNWLRGEVHLAGGVYNIDDQIDVPARVGIHGSTRVLRDAGTILNWTGANDSSKYVLLALHSDAINANGNFQCHWRNFAVECNNAVNGISWGGAQCSSLKNVHVRGVPCNNGVQPAGDLTNWFANAVNPAAGVGINIRNGTVAAAIESCFVRGNEAAPPEQGMKAFAFDSQVQGVVLTACYVHQCDFGYHSTGGNGCITYVGCNAENTRLPLYGESAPLTALGFRVKNILQNVSLERVFAQVTANSSINILGGSVQSSNGAILVKGNAITKTVVADGDASTYNNFNLIGTVDMLGNIRAEDLPTSDVGEGYLWNNAGDVQVGLPS